MGAIRKPLGVGTCALFLGALAFAIATRRVTETPSLPAIPAGTIAENPLLPASAPGAVKRAKIKWDKSPLSYANRLVNYEANGHYLNGGIAKLCSEEPEAKNVDGNGIATKLINGKYWHHPVLSAQCGLAAYTAHLNGNKQAAAEAIAYADHLISMQDERGAFPYPFPYLYYVTDKYLPAGWVCGMAQGQALSLFARVYSITRDEKYLKAGKKALDFLLVPVDQGGVLATLSALKPEWNDLIIFEEYVADPPTYTLNGFIFALLGLYDWSQLEAAENYGRAQALDMFNKGMKTLEAVLPYYDMKGMTAYDLAYITHKKDEPHVVARYHGIHIIQLHALGSVTGSKTVKYWQARWQSYVE